MWVRIGIRAVLVFLGLKLLSAVIMIRIPFSFHVQLFKIRSYTPKVLMFVNVRAAWSRSNTAATA